NRRGRRCESPCKLEPPPESRLSLIPFILSRNGHVNPSDDFNPVQAPGTPSGLQLSPTVPQGEENSRGSRLRNNSWSRSLYPGAVRRGVQGPARSRPSGP